MKNSKITQRKEKDTRIELLTATVKQLKATLSLSAGVLFFICFWLRLQVWVFRLTDNICVVNMEYLPAAGKLRQYKHVGRELKWPNSIWTNSTIWKKTSSCLPSNDKLRVLPKLVLFCVIFDQIAFWKMFHRGRKTHFLLGQTTESYLTQWEKLTLSSRRKKKNLNHLSALCSHQCQYDDIFVRRGPRTRPSVSVRFSVPWKTQ